MQNIFTFGVKTRLWFIILYGGVGEWFIPEVLKTSAPEMVPSVRIRPPPLNIQISKNLLYLLRFCYVFVCFKDSHRNNKKLKLII